eukprot:scaffold30978_cov65-Phaeocystis_antarctica.AAC.3
MSSHAPQSHTDRPQTLQWNSQTTYFRAPVAALRLDAGGRLEKCQARFFPVVLLQLRYKRKKQLPVRCAGCEAVGCGLVSRFAPRLTLDERTGRCGSPSHTSRTARYSARLCRSTAGRARRGGRAGASCTPLLGRRPHTRAAPAAAARRRPPPRSPPGVPWPPSPSFWPPSPYAPAAASPSSEASPAGAPPAASASGQNVGSNCATSGQIECCRRRGGCAPGGIRGRSPGGGRWLAR